MVELASNAFANCLGLTNLTIGSAVTNIGMLPFQFTRSLQIIDVDELNPLYSSVAGVLCDRNKTARLVVPPAKTGVYFIPEGVTKIADYAFTECDWLTSVIVPSSVTNVGFDAFYSCYLLKGVYFQGNAPRDAYSVFYATDGTIVYFLAGTTGWGTNFCGHLTKLFNPDMPWICVTNQGALTITKFLGWDEIALVPASIYGMPVTSIGQQTFAHCTGLLSVNIPDSVTNIDYMAFAACYYLQSVTFGRNANRMASYAFAGCGRLKAFYFLGNAPVDNPYLSYGTTEVVVYCLPGTTGWGTTFANRPTVVWNARINMDGPNFGVSSNQFAFQINGTSNLVVVIEATTNFTNPIWTVLGTNNLTGGTSYFSGPKYHSIPCVSIVFAHRELPGGRRLGEAHSRCGLVTVSCLRLFLAKYSPSHFTSH